MENKESKKILIVEDDEVSRKLAVEFFKSKGWNVMWAANGDDAITIIRGNDYHFNCIVTDLRMPKMDGRELMELLQADAQANKIPIIVLSAYVENLPAMNKMYYERGAVAVLSKPAQLEIVELIANSSRREFTDKNLAKRAKDMYSIDAITKIREEALIKQYFQAIDNTFILDISVEEHLFVVARRWNSWYPSFFNVPGGCYAVINPVCIKRKRPRVVVIDPGFRFLKVLSDIGITIKDIETCIITHNHPDHIGGVFEYIASRHAADEGSRLVCNATTCAMFNGYSQADLVVQNMNVGRQSVLKYEDQQGKLRELI